MGDTPLEDLLDKDSVEKILVDAADVVQNSTCQSGDEPKDKIIVDDARPCKEVTALFEKGVCWSLGPLGASCRETLACG